MSASLDITWFPTRAGLEVFFRASAPWRSHDYILRIELPMETPLDRTISVFWLIELGVGAIERAGLIPRGTRFQEGVQS